MQKTIKKDMAFGIPGTHGNGQPYFADPYTAGDKVTMGGVAALKDGMAVPYSESATTAIGIFVNPNEHIKMELPSDSVSLDVAKGSNVAVAKKGAWFVPVPSDATENAKWVVGAKLVYSATTYALAVDTTNAVAEILKVDNGELVSTAYVGGVALIRFL